VPRKLQKKIMMILHERQNVTDEEEKIQMISHKCQNVTDEEEWNFFSMDIKPGHIGTTIE